MITVSTTEVNLRVYEHGDRAAETIVLVHGYPDNHSVWDGVVDELGQQFHVVTYDVRGTGASSAPAQRSGYRIGRLIDDLVAVIEAVRSDGRPVHLVGHDWGAVQTWAAVLSNDTRLLGRIQTYTTMSGPDLSIFGGFVRSGMRRGNRRKVLRQIGHSWYVLAFQLPLVPELVFRHFGGSLRRTIESSEGLSGSGHFSDSFVRDASNGVNMYRENGLRFDHPTTDVPVQLLLPVRDAYVSPEIFDDAERYAPNLTRVEIDDTHWALVKQPALIARHIRDFAQTR